MRTATVVLPAIVLVCAVLLPSILADPPLKHEWIRRLPELTDERSDRSPSVTEVQRNALWSH